MLFLVSPAHQVQRRRPPERGGEEDPFSQGGRQEGREAPRSWRSRWPQREDRRWRRPPRPPHPRRHGTETQLRLRTRRRAQRRPLLRPASVRRPGSKPELDFCLDSLTWVVTDYYYFIFYCSRNELDKTQINQNPLAALELGAGTCRICSFQVALGRFPFIGLMRLVSRSFFLRNATVNNGLKGFLLVTDTGSVESFHCRVEPPPADFSRRPQQGCLLFLLLLLTWLFFLTCCFSLPSEESRTSLIRSPSLSLSSITTCIIWTCHVFCFFMLNLNLLRNKSKTCKTHEKKGKYYLNWGLKNPDVWFFSRSLSLFLKGTCTLLLGQSCVLLPPLYLAMDLSYLFILSGQELNCRGFIWVMLACNTWIHGCVWMEHASNHVSNPVKLLLPMHFICHHV